MTNACEGVTPYNPSPDDTSTTDESVWGYTPAEANYTNGDGEEMVVDVYIPPSKNFDLNRSLTCEARVEQASILPALIGLAILLGLIEAEAGCDSNFGANPDAGPTPLEDGSHVDANVPEAGRLDAGPDVGVVPPAEILQLGSNGFLLRGIVLKPDETLDPGEVLIIGNEIVCADVDCSSSSGYTEATWIDTHGIISPGLIDSHNHVAYNFLPEWVPTPPRFFNNRYEWAEDPDYENHIAPYADNRSSNTHFCPAAKWGELRSLVHGTTTMQEQPSASGSCINWGVRNANRYHGLGYDHMDANIASVRDITDADAADILAGFESATEPTTRLHVHMAEGVSDDYIDEEFASYAGRDSRPNRHNGTSLVGPQSILIHAMAVTEAELAEAAEAGAKVVWSPSSNMALYNQTADIQRILEVGITTGLGPDWTVSGEDEMLSEMRYALSYARGEIEGSVESPLVTPERLWQMATSEGAVVLDLDGKRPGLEGRIGRLESGYRADIAVFATTGSNLYEALINSRAQDVRMVLIDGAVFYGDENLRDATARNDYCEDFDACGTPKFICVQDSPTADNRRNETLADIRGQLVDILAGYGRKDDLLELVDCSD